MKYGYMCGVDYQCELEPDQRDGVPIYSTVEHLKSLRTCWKECGIVKVKIEVIEWTEEQNFTKLGDSK